MFPTPLTSIERFHYFDSTSEYPNLIGFRLLLAKQFDERIARLAYCYVANRHGFLERSITSESGRLVWQHNATNTDRWPEISDRMVRFETAETPFQQGTIPNELRRSIISTPYLLVRQSKTHELADRSTPRSEVWCWAHHSLFDGAGAVTAINDWIQVYENLTHRREPLEGLATLDWQLFRDRNRLDLTRWTFIKQLPWQWVAIFGATKFAFRQTTTLTQDRTVQKTAQQIDDQPTNAHPNFVSGQIDAATIAQLNQEAIRHSASLNSLMVSALFRALQRWRDSLKTNEMSGEWFRIILPINLRTLAHRRLPATNRSSLVQLDRRAPRQEPWPTFVRLIHREISLIFKWKLDRTFLIAIRGLSLFDRWLRRAAAADRSRGLTVFTNLGTPLKSLEKRITRGQCSSDWSPLELNFFGPLRTGTPFNVAVAQFQNAVQLTLHFDSKVVTEEMASRLLEEFVDELKAVAQGLNDEVVN